MLAVDAAGMVGCGRARLNIAPDRPIGVSFVDNPTCNDELVDMCWSLGFFSMLQPRHQVIFEAHLAWFLGTGGRSFTQFSRRQ